MVGDPTLNEIADAARDELQKRVEAATGMTVERNRLLVIQQALELYVRDRVDRSDWQMVAAAALELAETKGRLSFLEATLCAVREKRIALLKDVKV